MKRWVIALLIGCQVAVCAAPAAHWIRGTIPGVETAELEQTLMRLRGLSFNRVVPAAIHSRDTLRQFLVEDLKREEDPAITAAVLRSFGFVGADFDLEKFRLDLLTEQIAGYYDPRTGEFNVIDQPGLLNWASGALLKSLMGFDSQRTVTIHEMDHALDDQHFHIQQLQDRVRLHHNSDESLALQALAEGEATWIMMADTMDSPVHSARLEGQTVQNLRDRMSLGLALSGRVTVNGQPVPLFFQRTLLFPYQYGLYFVHHLRTLGTGWDSVNQAWGDLPDSTQQILHPEDYSGTRVEPADIRLTGPVTLAGWKSIADDSLGEFLLGVFVEQHTGAPAEAITSRWIGDRYRIYQHGQKTAMVWLTDWSSPADAVAAAALLTRIWPTGMDVRLQGSQVLVASQLLADSLRTFRIEGRHPSHPRVAFNDAWVRARLDAAPPSLWQTLTRNSTRDLQRSGTVWTSPARHLAVTVPSDWTMSTQDEDSRVLLSRYGSDGGFLWDEDHPLPHLADYRHYVTTAPWLKEPGPVTAQVRRVGRVSAVELQFEAFDTKHEKIAVHCLMIPVGAQMDGLYTIHPLTASPVPDALQSVRLDGDPIIR